MRNAYQIQLGNPKGICLEAFTATEFNKTLGSQLHQSVKISQCFRD
jgi:hypothetical protein